MSEYVWQNDLTDIFMKDGYLLPGQTLDERVNIICSRAEEILQMPGFAHKFKTNLQKGWYSLSTPIWSNFGTNRGLPISCFGSWIDDSMESILHTNSEVGMMTKYGGGTSAYFGKLRPRGADIRENGKSSGSVHFMKMFETTMTTISQGSTRRGSFAAYLDIDHPDIEEFLGIKSEGHPIQDISFGVCVPDYWMKEMIDGDIHKRRVWAKVLEARANVGYPYIHFVDNANNNTVDVYKDKDMRINSSNLCVAPETLLLTPYGERPIFELYQEFKDIGLRVWNGFEWSLSQIMKTGVNQKLIKIIFSDDTILECTPYHTFYVLDQFDNEYQICATNLKLGHRIQNSLPNSNKIITVKELIDEGRFDDTYCVNEPKNHKAVFNGILTGNCNEIMLPTNSDESFVCDLSSMNILYFDDWKDTDAVELLVYFLDAVMSEFIEKAKSIAFMDRAVRFAERHRALGVGWLGWHSYLQSKMIPFESLSAKLQNGLVAQTIRDKTYKASKDLAEIFGEPELLKGYGRRNTTLLAIAPTKSSAFLLGQVSEGIEPHRTNYYVKDLQKGKFTIKNKHLENLLSDKGYDTDDVWKSIIMNGGSVQHLDFLSDHEKEVFKTFAEISPKEIIIQASTRQKYIDQGQSLNLMIHPSIPVKDINALMIEAWKMGIKGLYYQISVNAAQQFSRDILNCVSCEA